MVGQQREGRHELDPERRALLDRHIAALDGPLACERLMDEIDRCCEAMGPPVRLDQRLVARARLAVRRSYRSVRKRSIRAKGNKVYLRHKFPGISVDEVNQRIGRLGSV